MVVNHKNKGTLETIREVKVINLYKTLHSDVVKNSLVLFLAEMLGSSIQEEERDEALYNYLEYSLGWMDENEHVSNFHILFLLNLTKYLGFYPDTSDREKNYFDLLEGNFSAQPSFNPVIEGETLDYFKRFLGINFDALLTVKMNNANRQKLLQAVILYFGLHLHGFRKPKSLAVLNAVFD